MKLILKTKRVPATRDIMRASAQAAAEELPAGGGPAHASVAYLKVRGKTAYVLLDVDRDGWAGAWASQLRIHPPGREDSPEVQGSSPRGVFRGSRRQDAGAGRVGQSVSECTATIARTPAAVNVARATMRIAILFDVEHLGNADHTKTGGTNIRRATVWEVHPIASIEPASAP